MSARLSGKRVLLTLMDEPAPERIRALTAGFPRIWNDERTGAVERKRMLGLLIEDVTLLVDDEVNIPYPLARRADAEPVGGQTTAYVSDTQDAGTGRDVDQRAARVRQRPADRRSSQ